MVEVEQGEKKYIEKMERKKMKKGDLKILTRFGFSEFRGIGRRREECVEITLENGESLRGSVGHRVKMDDGRFCRLDEISVGERVCCLSGPARVIGTRRIGEMDVFSPVEVRGDDTYISWCGEKGVVSHNCSFGGSSSTLVSEEALEKIKIMEPAERLMGYDMLVYEKPVEGGLYVMGVDCAMGVAGDYSVIQVLKVTKKGEYTQVGVYRRNTIRPEEFAEIVLEVAKMYNGAMHIVENNDVGRSVVYKLYYELGDEWLISTDKTGALGTHADRGTKMEACRLLKESLEKGELVVVDSETVKELSKFEETQNGSFKAAGNGHDDLVAALYWARYCLEQPEIDLDAVKVADSGRTVDAPPPLALTDGCDDGVYGLGMSSEDFWRGLN